jgi:hypothetical protein
MINKSSYAKPSRFSDKLLKLLERIEHRVALSVPDREAVFRMRYEAYVRNGLMENRADRRFYDQPYDDAVNSWITMTYIDGKLAGSARVNVGSERSPLLPCLRVYADVIEPRLRIDWIIVECTRLAAQLDLARTHPELAYLIMRPCYMAAQHFKADFAVATPRAEHMPFYRRVFRYEKWCEPRNYPGLTAKFGCMGVDFRASQNLVEARFPFFRSTQEERNALFGPATVAVLGAENEALFNSAEREYRPRGGCVVVTNETAMTYS